MSTLPLSSSNSSGSSSSSTLGSISFDVKENKHSSLNPPPIPNAEVLNPKDLNPYFYGNAAKDYGDQSCRAKLLKAAAILSVIFYIALAALATVLVTLWAPTFLPFVAVATLALMFPMYQLFQYVWQKALAQQLLADFNGSVTKELKQLNTPAAVNASLMSLGISQDKNIEPKNYAEVIARHNYYSNQTDLLTENLETLREKINELGNQRTADSVKTRRDLVVKAYDCQQQRAQHKLRAAWMINILTDPKNQTPLEGTKGLGEFNIETFDHRTLDNHSFNVQEVQNDSDDFFRFNNQEFKNLPLNEVDTASIQDLAKLLANPTKKTDPDASPATPNDLD